MIEPGTRLIIHYPRRNDICSDWQFQPRDIEISRVRDLVRQPLTIDDFLRRPYIRRSRHLVLAFDHGLRQWRNFYLGTCREFAAPNVLQIGIYCNGKLVRLLDRPFAPTVFDHRLMVRMIPRWQARLRNHESFGIFAPDLQIRSDVA